MLIAEFGSKHNGSTSRYSDRDLLIVSNDWNRIKYNKSYYESLGFSVTSFHTSKALYLAKEGSLFFKHIIDQSHVISDHSCILGALYNNWTPKKDYEHEIESNIDLLELINYLPKSKYYANYTVDLVIISIRNILIRMLAKTGKYVFDWENLAKTAFKYGYISYNDMALITHARGIKNRYRSGVYDAISDHVVNGLISILNSIQNKKMKVRFITHKQILSLPDQFNNGSYKQLKALEAICCLYSYSPSMKQYMKLVKDPNYTCGAKALTKHS